MAMRAPFNEPDDLAFAVHPLVCEDVPAAKPPSIGEKEEARGATGESPARFNQVPHPPPARHVSQDPEVRQAEVLLVKSPPPRLLIGEELSEEAGLAEPFPHDRHRTAVGF